MEDAHMNPTVTKSDELFFKENGYLVLKNFYTNEEKNDIAIQLAKITYEFSRKIKLNPVLDLNFSSKASVSGYLDEFVCQLEEISPDILFLLNCFWGYSSRIYALACNPKILELCEKILDIDKDLLFVGSGDTLVNLPNNNRLHYRWHNAENGYPKRQVYLNFWTPLVRNKTQTNGTLLICPKSHISSHPFIESKGPSKSGKGRLTQRRIPMEYVDKFEKIHIEAGDTDLLVMHPRLIHSSSSNSSSKPSYVAVFKVWNNSLDWTLSPQLSVLPYQGDDLYDDIGVVNRKFPNLLIN
jgi:ectoine hydroxylase-related dioxygenase (phytanoyl-CoA dioxygenase family)